MRAVGFGLAIAGVLLVTSLGNSPLAFVNVPGLVFVLLVGIGVVLASHGTGGIRAVSRYASGRAVGRQRERAGRVLETAIQAFVAAGWIGVLIGAIQGLASLDDPASMGPALATCLLTPLYGYLLAYLVFLPMARRIEPNPISQNPIS